MSTRAYTVLGWVVWQVGKRVAGRKMKQNKTKLGAGAVVAAVALAGLVAAKAATSGDDG
jgi:hypothetical protein